MSRAQEAARQLALVQYLLNRQDLAPDTVSELGLAGLAGVQQEHGDGLGRGLLAYRVNAQAAAAKALAAAYPRLRDELGESQFERMAWSFWRRHPPDRGDLASWGEELGAVLAAQPGMDPVLPDCARVEWAMALAERASDTELDALSLQLLGELPPERLQLRLRPGLCLIQADIAAVRRVVAAPPEAVEDQVDGRLLTLLIWRRAWRAEACVLAPDWAFFMNECLTGSSLQQSLDRTLASHPSFDFAAWLQAALSEAWLQAVLTFEETPT